MDVFEGSPEMWAKLKVGDVLRVEAEGNENVPWKATEAILVSKASKTAVAAEEQQTKSVSFMDEEGDRSKLKRDDATRFLSWHAQGQCFLERTLFYYATTRQFCALSGNGWDKEERRR